MIATNHRGAIGRLIVALDVPTSDAALALVSQLRGHVGLFKVGLELFAHEGPGFVRTLVEQDLEIFLDLKFHDIPNTVRAAAREAARLGVSMMTVHTSGGVKMMQAATEGAREGTFARRAPLVLGVTVLTSLGSEDLADIGWRDSPGAVVHRLAGLARSAGLDGVVASPQEAALIRGDFGPGFAIVTPGIRPAAAALDDQARAATPRAALEAGSDFLVVGRPITQSPDPVSAADAIVEEMKLVSTPHDLEAALG